MLILERERERRGMRVKDLERKKRVWIDRGKRKERGRGKHVNGFRRVTFEFE
jgi:hypothetical protein